MRVHDGRVIRVNLGDAKAHLSRYLARLVPGEVIVLCRRNVPVAEIRLLPGAPRQKRPIGLAKGKFEVPKSFFDPLADELLDRFQGGRSRRSSSTGGSESGPSGSRKI
jgi:antitoxin (DNA-binding transcriptional repressor) of toxin-antitoxin stability system